MPGKRIKHFRESRGLSQAQMAERLHLSLPVYTAIEDKEKDLTVGQLKMIASILKVQLEELLPDELLINNLLYEKV